MASPVGAKSTYSADSTEAYGGGFDASTMTATATATEPSRQRQSSPIKTPRLVAGLLPRSASKTKPPAGYNDDPGETLETYVLPPKLRMDQGGDDTAGLEVIKVSKVRGKLLVIGSPY